VTSKERTDEPVWQARNQHSELSFSNTFTLPQGFTPLTKAPQPAIRTTRSASCRSGCRGWRIALDSTTGLEQQLRTTVERLQTVERNGIRIDGLSRETANLRAELSKLRAAGPNEAASPPCIYKLICFSL
jgi:hypothetical protein